MSIRARVIANLRASVALQVLEPTGQLPVAQSCHPDAHGGEAPLTGTLHPDEQPPNIQPPDEQPPDEQPPTVHPRIEQAYPLRQLPLLVAGDVVHCERENDVLRVVHLEPRTSVLERADRRGMKPLAANLTHLGIVSADPPGIDTLLIDQFCLAAYRAGVDALIVVNKADVLDEQERSAVDTVLNVYRSIGYPAVAIDTKSDHGIEPLLKELPGRALTLVGASGVGKSSIIQKLLPDRALRIGAVSAATGIGSHTTSVTFWYELPHEGAVIDSPGVRQYSVAHLSPQLVRAGYLELAEAAQRCRFGDCTHTVEPACGVLQALHEERIAQWRYDNYRKLAGV